MSVVSGRESLDRDILPKAIFSFYSTLWTSHLFGWFAFRASELVTPNTSEGLQSVNADVISWGQTGLGH